MPLVFDAYGTLLDVDAAARDAVHEFPEIKNDWPILAQRWRERQLRYSWLRSLMQQYVPFWQITCEALDVTLNEMDLADGDLRSRLLSLYLELKPFDEVPDFLQTLKGKGHQLAVLSNGNPEMLDKALTHAGIKSLFDAVISVDPLQCYKPDPRVYQMVPDQFDCMLEDITFFSSNNWDIAGAGSFGFKTIWVNRAGHTWDDVPEQPHQIVKSLIETSQNF